MSKAIAAALSAGMSNGVASEPRLSVIVITLNEEACIERCLRSVSFADEIIVVDSGSTDQTCEIARALGARVIVTDDWLGFGTQKNRALAAANGTWVLSLDADEWVDPALAAEIGATLRDPGDRAGFEIPRRSRFCGRIVHHGSWSPDWVLRLFRRDCGRFTYSIVHEKVLLDGRTGRLRQALEHDCISDLTDAREKITSYSGAAATELRKKGAERSVRKAFWRSLWTYFHCYVIKLGLLDGSVGLLVAAYSASQTYRKWSDAPTLSAKAPVRRVPVPSKSR